MKRMKRNCVDKKEDPQITQIGTDFFGIAFYVKHEDNFFVKR